MALMLWLCLGLQLCWRYWSWRWCWAWAWWTLPAMPKGGPRPPRPPLPAPFEAIVAVVMGCESSSSKISETESVTAGLFIDSPNERRMSQPPRLTASLGLGYVQLRGWSEAVEAASKTRRDPMSICLKLCVWFDNYQTWHQKLKITAFGKIFFLANLLDARAHDCVLCYWYNCNRFLWKKKPRVLFRMAILVIEFILGLDKSKQHMILGFAIRNLNILD